MKRLKLIIYISLIISIFITSVFSNAEVTPMTVSQNGIDFIKGFEGFRATAYWDYQQWSIGYGTACEENQYPDGITKEFAEQLLLQNVVTYVGYVNTFLNKNSIVVNQNQFDALTSFTYNLGNVWNRPDFTLRDMLVDGIEKYSDDQVKNAFGLWCKAGGQVNDGLVRRRAAEAVLFLSDEDFQVIEQDYEIWITSAQSGLRLRSGPGSQFSQVSLIPYNTTIKVTNKEEADGFLWGETTYEGIPGWCALDYAEFISIHTQPATITTEETTTGETTAEETTIGNPNTTGNYDGPLIYGDVNNDGKVNSKDVLLLKKHAANWVVEINKLAADVNLDSQINSKDVLLLRRFLANWDIQLGEEATTALQITVESTTASQTDQESSLETNEQ